MPMTNAQRQQKFRDRIATLKAFDDLDPLRKIKALWRKTPAAVKAEFLRTLAK
jgi:hypothetical protein